MTSSRPSRVSRSAVSATWASRDPGARLRLYRTERTPGADCSARRVRLAGIGLSRIEFADKRFSVATRGAESFVQANGELVAALPRFAREPRTMPAGRWTHEYQLKPRADRGAGR